MICRGYVQIPAGSGNKSVTWTYPKEFITTPLVVATPVRNGSILTKWWIGDSAGTSQSNKTSAMITGTNTSNYTASMNCLAYGRWK